MATVGKCKKPPQFPTAEKPSRHFTPPTLRLNREIAPLTSLGPLWQGLGGVRPAASASGLRRHGGAVETGTVCAPQIRGVKTQAALTDKRHGERTARRHNAG
ncbi:hypothetical protein AAFF_G00251740 [Aldrovandia affinis]|uniref:Uncharacterized protein n=1 Tax=Aldrovandia affinis TaxID=143900 RepID=A0AAD7WUA3_9TELE|nr:hypothetical protein AAFF_G00251740 [Aldrovandia affinis]